MKKLKLARETIRSLSNHQLGDVQGAGTIIIIRTTACPVLTNGCTGGPCVETINTPGTSVINPSGG